MNIRFNNFFLGILVIIFMHETYAADEIPNFYSIESLVLDMKFKSSQLLTGCVEYCTQREKYERAEQLFESVVPFVDPYYEEKETQGARPYDPQAIARFDRDCNNLLIVCGLTIAGLGKFNRDRKRFSRATALYSKAVSFLDSDVLKKIEVLSDLAHMHSENKEWENARECHKNIIDLYPKHASIQLDEIGYTYEQQEKLQKAASYYLQAFKKDTTDLISAVDILYHSTLFDQKNDKPFLVCAANLLFGEISTDDYARLVDYQGNDRVYIALQNAAAWLVNSSKTQLRSSNKVHAD